MVLSVASTLAAPSLTPTMVKEMEKMFLRLGFSQAVVLKLVDDQGIDSPSTLASLSDKDITAICNVICQPSGLLSGKTPVRGNQFSVLATKNPKLMAFMFKTMEHCSKDNKIQDVTSASVLSYQHEWSWNRRNQTTSRIPKMIKITGQTL